MSRINLLHEDHPPRIRTFPMRSCAGMLSSSAQRLLLVSCGGCQDHTSGSGDSVDCNSVACDSIQCIQHIESWERTEQNVWWQWQRAGVTWQSNPGAQLPGSVVVPAPASFRSVTMPLSMRSNRIRRNRNHQILTDESVWRFLLTVWDIIIEFFPTWEFAEWCLLLCFCAVAYLQHNSGGITVYGFALDRGLLHTLLAFEFSLVLWILSKVVVLTSSWTPVKAKETTTARKTVTISNLSESSELFKYDARIIFFQIYSPNVAPGQCGQFQRSQLGNVTTFFSVCNPISHLMTNCLFYAYSFSPILIKIQFKEHVMVRFFLLLLWRAWSLHVALASNRSCSAEESYSPLW